MKVFISINGLRCGGAEKSLISFLNEIPKEYIRNHELEVDLLVLYKKGYFFNNVPDWINWLDTDDYLDGLFENTKEHFRNPVSLLVLMKKIGAKVKMKISKPKNASNVQHIWSCWKDIIPEQKKEYDLAISYVDGFSNYYVIDKVKAPRKILWVHNEYEKLNYNQTFDELYFDKADAIVTISDRCKSSLVTYFPRMKEKIHMIPNISSPKSIWQMAEEDINEDFGKDNSIVSIGRLSEQKGFDLAIDAAEKLRTKIDFTWYIIGEGELKEFLQERIDAKGLNKNVFLVGNRNNPYPYIQKAKIFVQTSKYEGKSIVLDEAKILEKPIIVTNYTTAKDSIIDGKNGIIVEHDAGQLASMIEKLLNNQDLQNEFAKNLKAERLRTSKYIDKYLNLITETCNMHR